jgi:phage tail sheath protein FI
MRSFVRYSMLVGSLIPALACAFTPISLSLGWNLVGNSDPAAIDVASKLNGSQITTVWKWNKVQSRWAFYTPTMSSSALLAYAASKGYDVLSTIDSKEGFWVNASAAVTISDLLAPPPAIGSVVTLSATDLVTNWN